MLHHKFDINDCRLTARLMMSELKMTIIELYERFPRAKGLYRPLRTLAYGQNKFIYGYHGLQDCLRYKNPVRMFTSARFDVSFA